MYETELLERGRRRMGKAWQQVLAVLVVLGVPTAVGTAWHRFVAAHAIDALLLTLVWLLMATVAVLCKKGAGHPG